MQINTFVYAIYGRTNVNGSPGLGYICLNTIALITYIYQQETNIELTLRGDIVNYFISIRT